MIIAAKITYKTKKRMTDTKKKDIQLQKTLSQYVSVSILLQCTSTHCWSRYSKSCDKAQEYSQNVLRPPSHNSKRTGKLPSMRVQRGSVTDFWDIQSSLVYRNSGADISILCVVRQSLMQWPEGRTVGTVYTQETPFQIFGGRKSQISRVKIIVEVSWRYLLP